jgi:hypothetical protein
MELLMRRNRLVGLIAFLVIAFFAWWILGHATPKGQPTLMNITQENLTEFERDFDNSGDQVRVLLLFSPTWPACVRGASAIESLLKQLPGEKLRILVVWEPILPSDWQSPTRPVLSRISDLRAAQYWDKDHLVAKLIKAQISPEEPNCCDHNGILWDLVALYPKRSDLRSKPSFIAGPVYKEIGNTRNRLSSMSGLGL